MSKFQQHGKRMQATRIIFTEFRYIRLLIFLDECYFPFSFNFGFIHYELYVNKSQFRKFRTDVNSLKTAVNYGTS